MFLMLSDTTAATGKGFAIRSAALTALALLASYIEEVKIGLAHVGQTTIELAGRTVDVATATIPDFIEYYPINLMNPKVLAGVFIGSMMSFLFCGLTMNAVGRAAQKNGRRGSPPVVPGDKRNYGRYRNSMIMQNVWKFPQKERNAK